ncbi:MULTISPECIES: DUF7527 domain-containing protein [Halolamina]|uniref:DUF7527 domain-containing protein n=1 Tax=Halolamina pelagica TaxID=699431 RepID=A0A1I5M2F9_9EURY|nr:MULTISPECIES: hypothetical protein [Halolamina]NHX35838.1 hypothetical protein [Halolamina sp. R1-12]SFP03828.1 hypothetical protein SAMN05216277_10173 [Halolamina pelagica]
MKSETVERVTEWDSEPFSGGHAGLREYAEREFTGAVTDGVAWLFMLNGRVLGVFDGGMDRFADADGTAYVAPDRSLPLLFAMQEIGGEVRGEYYTEETPLSEVDRTLQSGNFTGYVELSENVLSGDYYLAYYGGRRMPVAFVGNQERRLTGDEAYERAADEVGIYRVKTVDIEIADVPDGADDSIGGAAAVDAEPAATEEDTTAEPDEAEPTTESEFATAPPTDADSEGSSPADRGASSRAGSEEPASTDAEGSTPTREGTAEPRTDPTPADGASAGSSQPAESASSGRARSATEAAEAAMANGENVSTAESSNESGGASAGGSDSAGRFEGESEWRETTTIPALDPAESVSMEAASESAEPPAAEGSAASEDVPSEAVTALREERDQLRERVEELEAETERLAGERDRLERERDEAAATAEELETEVAELRATVDELEEDLRVAETELEAAQEYMPEGDREIPPEEAMAGTSLFVRYERKGGPTLEDAYNGDADRDEVNDNLRLEHHTEFDEEGAVVDGAPFEEWLRGTVEYGFVEWLTRSLLHDVRETRNQTAMGKLFGAIPEIDRIEFRGSVDLGEEAEEERASFDVVLRDRMGQPLIVTDLNSSREPATEPMLESLLRNATPVGETNEGLAAAFFVTSSYYEPGALETAEEATGGGFLGRGKRKSFVKLSRKDGYHLSLVETRDGEFHVSVPEL